MGLDMYLYKKTYVQNWDFKKPEERYEIDIKLGGKPRADIKPDRIAYIIEQVGYWRKANAIHNWFVNEVQNGKDDCRDSYVEIDQLKKLLELCQQVLESRDLAPKLLPTVGGVFFGDTSYSEYYFSDLADTVKIITGLLEEEKQAGPDFGAIYYHSSW